MRRWSCSRSSSTNPSRASADRKSTRPNSRQPPISLLVPYTTLFRSVELHAVIDQPEAELLGDAALELLEILVDEPEQGQRRSEEHTSELQATTDISPRSLHDALPICRAPCGDRPAGSRASRRCGAGAARDPRRRTRAAPAQIGRAHVRTPGNHRYLSSFPTRRSSDL